MRAARLLRTKIHSLDGRGGEGTDPNHEANVRWLAHVTPEDAALIDRETKAGEMAAMLHKAWMLVVLMRTFCELREPLDKSAAAKMGEFMREAEGLLTDLEVKP